MKVGVISAEVVCLLTGGASNQPIEVHIGQTNIDHIKTQHDTDFEVYGNDLQIIVENPDYAGLNPKDGSIELIKVYEDGIVFVKVAVRQSSGGIYYVRSLYTVNQFRVMDYVRKGFLFKVDND